MTLNWKEKGNLSFLVVDDIANVRMIIRDMLRYLGYSNVTEAEDGVVGWNKLVSQKIDLAIVDWNMPRMNGIELLRKARSRSELADIPFIIVSGEVGDETIAEAAETEVDAYIIKPFVAATLDEKIIGVLNRTRNPLPIDSQLKQITAYGREKQFGKALAELKKAILLYPRDPRITLAFAKTYKEMGLHEDAEKSYKRTLYFEPKFVKAYDGLAELYRQTGDEKKLIGTLKEGLAVSPKNASRQAEFGKACLESGLTDEAKRAFNEALKAEPNNSIIQHEMAEVLMAKGMDKEATLFFQAASRANPGDLHTYNRLGIAFRKQGKYEEAFDEYRKALLIAPNDENLCYNLGRAYFEVGRNDEALGQFKRALQINPALLAAREMVAAIEEGTGQDQR
jgi:tetratricopeptide (TPR) repeat protein